MAGVADDREADDREDEELFRRARQGDRDALDALCRRHRDRLKAEASDRLIPLLRRRIDTSDMVQDAFLEVLCRPPQFEPERGTVAALFNGIMTNVIKRAINRHWRKKKRDPRREAQRVDGLENLVRDCGQPTPTQDLVARERDSRVQESVSELPEDDQIVIRLRHWDGLTFPKIAQILGETKEAVQQRHYRALKKLGLLLDDPSESSHD